VWHVWDGRSAFVGGHVDIRLALPSQNRSPRCSEYADHKFVSAYNMTIPRFEGDDKFTGLEDCRIAIYASRPVFVCSMPPSRGRSRPPVLGIPAPRTSLRGSTAAGRPGGSDGGREEDEHLSLTFRPLSGFTSRRYKNITPFVGALPGSRYSKEDHLLLLDLSNGEIVAVQGLDLGGTRGGSGGIANLSYALVGTLRRPQRLEALPLRGSTQPVRLPAAGGEQSVEGGGSLYGCVGHTTRYGEGMGRVYW
jgi:hypothetical protein